MSGTSETLESKPPICPRCDYDLRGEVARWESECPLVSRCPECGFDVRWTTVFRLTPPPSWSVEHAQGSRWAVLGKVFASAWRAYLPRCLWRGLTLAMPVVPRRLGLMLGVWVVASYVLSAGLMAGTIWVEGWLESRMYLQMFRGVPGMNPVSFGQPTDATRWIFPYFNIANQWYGVPREPVMLCVLFGLVMPAAMVLMPMSLRRAKVRSRHIVRLTGYWLVWVPALAIVPAWTDSLYRMTVHLRNMATAPWQVDALRWVQSVSNAMVAIAVFLVVAWYWRAAAKHYLKLPRPSLVGLGLVGVASLLTLAAGYFIVPGADDVVTRIFYELTGP